MDSKMKALKTPLRYPGGKSRATKYICPRFPKKISEYREPFLGGGSVAIEFGKRCPDVPIWVNDFYTPLAVFWTQLRDSGQDLRDRLTEIKLEHNTPDKAKELFNEYKESLYDGDDLERAVKFYLINKCSFSGLTESSSFSKQASESNFSLRGIDKLPEYSRMIAEWKITNLHYEELLGDDEDVFIYLDPPYDIKIPIYGKRGAMHKHFDHDKFAIDCDNYTSPMLISYNSSQIVKDRFSGLQWSASEFDLTYSMRTTGDYMQKQAERKELILMNY